MRFVIYTVAVQAFSGAAAPSLPICYAAGYVSKQHGLQYSQENNHTPLSLACRRAVQDRLTLNNAHFVRSRNRHSLSKNAMPPD